MIDLAAVPLERVLGAEVGGVYRDLHAEHGVDLRLGVGVESLGGTTAVEEVRLTDGTVCPPEWWWSVWASLPRTELAEAAGLTVDNGVVVDENLRHERARRLRRRGRGQRLPSALRTHIRLEHWSAALNQGPAAAQEHARASPRRTTGCRTSTPTSTTSGWSTGVGHPPWTRWCSGATPAPGSSSPSGCTEGRSCAPG